MQNLTENNNSTISYNNAEDGCITVKIIVILMALSCYLCGMIVICTPNAFKRLSLLILPRNEPEELNLPPREIQPSTQNISFHNTFNTSLNSHIIDTPPSYTESANIYDQLPPRYNDLQ
ncbi:hypothetical protein NEIRO02_2170 [Nematocida sp. AWRm79]|nr:hypothetical protein NEIRO02_2170 [Nematocida sp. AWRm79]